MLVMPGLRATCRGDPDGSREETAPVDPVNTQATSGLVAVEVKSPLLLRMFPTNRLQVVCK